MLTRFALAAVVGCLHRFSKVRLDRVECLRGDCPVQMISRLCRDVIGRGGILPDLRLQTLEGFFDQFLEEGTTLLYELVEWL